MRYLLTKMDKKRYGRPLMLAAQQPDKVIHFYIHRRPCRVFVDGREVGQVFFANLKKCIVRRYKYPFKLDKHRKRALTETLHGNIEIVDLAS